MSALLNIEFGHTSERLGTSLNAQKVLAGREALAVDQVCKEFPQVT